MQLEVTGTMLFPLPWGGGGGCDPDIDPACESPCDPDDPLCGQCPTCPIVPPGVAGRPTFVSPVRMGDWPVMNAARPAVQLCWPSRPPRKKNNPIDAKKICDCLRCDFLPECYMVSTATRERRRTLRYRNLLVRQMVQMKNKISMLLTKIYHGSRVAGQVVLAGHKRGSKKGRLRLKLARPVDARAD